MDSGKVLGGDMLDHMRRSRILGGSGEEEDAGRVGDVGVLLYQQHGQCAEGEHHSGWCKRACKL
jgi:hypothetical protein